jgi:hypothetical protein
LQEFGEFGWSEMLSGNTRINHVFEQRHRKGPKI